MKLSFGKEVRRIAPKGTSRAVFQTVGGLYLVWMHGEIYVSGEIPVHRNHPLWFGGVKVTDVELEAYDMLTLVGCEVNGLVFETHPESSCVLPWDFRVGELLDPYEELEEWLLCFWETKAKRFSPSALKCEITQDRILNNIVGAYYNSERGYYTTLQNLVDYYGMENTTPIHKLDEAMNRLKDGYEAIRYRGADIAYDGLNFEIKEKRC